MPDNINYVKPSISCMALQLLLCCTFLIMPVYASAKNKAKLNTNNDTKSSTVHAPATMLELAGTYYLQGVMEVGSMLHLNAQGKFDYRLTYGAVDLVASGTWQINGSNITLTSQPQEKTEPTHLNASRAWDKQAEQKWLEVLSDNNEIRPQKHCRILYQNLQHYDEPPPACVNTLSTKPSDNPDDWHNNVLAVIVYVGDTYNKHSTISRVSLRFEFSDGSTKTVNVSDGYALTQKPVNADLKSVVLIGLTDPVAGTSNTKIAILDNQPVQEIKVSLPHPQPVFETLHLVRTDERTLTLISSDGELKSEHYVRYE